MICRVGDRFEIRCAEFEKSREFLRAEEGRYGTGEEDEIGREESFVVELTGEEEREEVECLNGGRETVSSSRREGGGKE